MCRVQKTRHTFPAVLVISGRPSAEGEKSNLEYTAVVIASVLHFPHNPPDFRIPMRGPHMPFRDWC